MNLKEARDLIRFQLNELEEIKNEAYDNSWIYKERKKVTHDNMISRKTFLVGQKVLWFILHLKLFPNKLCSCWNGPCTIINIFSHGTVKIQDKRTLKEINVNGHRLKP